MASCMSVHPATGITFGGYDYERKFEKRHLLGSMPHVRLHAADRLWR